MVMVGMPRFPVRKDDRLRPELPDHGREPQFVLTARLNVRIGHPQRAAPLYGEQFRSVPCLFPPDLRGTACSHLSGGQLKDSSLVSTLRHQIGRASCRERVLNAVSAAAV